MTNSVDPDQTAPIGAVCSGSILFASVLNSSVMLGNYLQQTTSADDIFRYIFFLGTLGVNTCQAEYFYILHSLPIFYSANLQNSSCKYFLPIRVENSLDPDQLTCQKTFFSQLTLSALISTLSYPKLNTTM